MTPGLRGDDPVLEHLSDEQINQLTDRNTVNHEEVIVVSKASAEKLKVCQSPHFNSLDTDSNRA